MTLPLLALLLLGPARAAEPDAPAGGEGASPAPAAATSGSAARPVADAPALAKELEALRAASGQTVLVAAAGPEAEDLAIRAAATLPGGAVRVVRVGYIGDPAQEAARALAAAGLRCAARVAPADGAWTLSTFGTCTPLPEAPVAAGKDAAAKGAAGQDAAAPAVARPDPAVLEDTWRAAALARVVDRRGATWDVRDGRGHALTAVQFAERTGDLSVSRRIARDRTRSQAVAWGLGIGGGSLLVASLGVLATRASGEPHPDTFEPAPDDYASSAEYLQAVEEAEGRYEDAVRSWEVRKEDRTWAAGFLAGTGLLALGVAPFAAQGASAREEEPALWWDVKRADQLIDGYNASLRSSLGLPAGVPAQPRPPAEGRVPSGLEDLPEDEEDAPKGGDAPDGGAAPDDGAGDPAPLPSSPDRPHLQVRPVLAPGWAGISGRF